MLMTPTLALDGWLQDSNTRLRDVNASVAPLHYLVLNHANIGGTSLRLKHA
jgi:hypothetical protein